VLPTKRRGEVAEAAFLHKAASLGFSVSKPWGESPFDSFPLRGQSLRAGSIRLLPASRSVPQGRLHSTPFRFAVSPSGQAPFDSFPLRGQSLRAGSIRLLPVSRSVPQGRLTRRYTAKDIDFIVGYVVPDDVWYIIPIAEFADKTTVKVFPSSRRRMSRFEMYRDAWDYLRDPTT
jgi:hypothetical protein